MSLNEANKASTYPVIRVRHLGHIISGDAHCRQVNMCSHGRNTTEALFSKHILHARLSFNLWFSSNSSSILSEKKKTNYELDDCICLY